MPHVRCTGNLNDDLRSFPHSMMWAA